MTLHQPLGQLIHSQKICYLHLLDSSHFEKALFQKLRFIESSTNISFAQKCPHIISFDYHLFLGSKKCLSVQLSAGAEVGIILSGWTKYTAYSMSYFWSEATLFADNRPSDIMGQ